MNLPLAPKFLQLTLTSGDPILLSLFAVAYALPNGTGTKIYLTTGTNDSISVLESFAALSAISGVYQLTRPSPVPYG